MKYFSTVYIFMTCSYEDYYCDKKGPSDLSIVEDLTEMAKFQLPCQDEYLKVAIF